MNGSRADAAAGNGRGAAALALASESGSVSLGPLFRVARRIRNSPPVVGTLRALPWGGAVILRYHSINDDPAWGSDYIQSSLAVPPDVFDRQVGYLARHHRIVSLTQLIDDLASGRRPDGRSVAITFDDGYEDNFRLAFPILRRHGATATFYVTTGAVDDASILWPVMLRHAIRRTEAREIAFRFLGSRPIDLSSERAKERAIRFLTGLVKHCGETRAREVLSEVEEADAHAYEKRVMMNWDEIREMHEGGMTIGAHTVRHYNLPSQDRETLTREIGESKRRLEDAIGAPVDHFAYPNGRTARHCDRASAAVVAGLGFRSAVTSVTGPASPRYSAYCLPRLGVVPRYRELSLLGAEIQYARFARPRNASLDEICRADPPRCACAAGETVSAASGRPGTGQDGRPLEAEATGR